MRPKKVFSELHGKDVNLYYALSCVAGQEGNDDHEYDLMQEASDYIQDLEKKVTKQEKLIQRLEEKYSNLLTS